MPAVIPKKKVYLTFNSVADISKFKHECECGDFYIDRDLIMLVGSFSEEQLQLAFIKYAAVSSPNLD